MPHIILMILPSLSQIPLRKTRPPAVHAIAAVFVNWGRMYISLVKKTRKMEHIRMPIKMSLSFLQFESISHRAAVIAQNPQEDQKEEIETD